MTNGYEHTNLGMLKKRSELIADGQLLRARQGDVGNTSESTYYALNLLGKQGDPDGMRLRTNRFVYFRLNERRRFVMDTLRTASGAVSARDLAEEIIGLEGKDARD
jgi:hypothetical protein